MTSYNKGDGNLKSGFTLTTLGEGNKANILLLKKVPKVIFFELKKLKHKQVFSRDSPGHGAPGLALPNERCVLYGAAAAALSHGDGGGYEPAKSGFQV